MPPAVNEPRVASHIRHARVEDLVVILDLRAADYSVLDAVASDMWDLLAETGDTEATLDRLTQMYDASPDRLRADLDRFVADCERRGFLDRGAQPASGAAASPEPPENGAPARPRATRAWTSLLATRRDLARGGLAAAYESCAQLPPPQRDPDPEALESALRSFLRAENAFVARRAPDDCLLRSLALYRFLRAAGLPCEHRIGVRRFPFTAHAWVEHDGSALLDDDNRTQGFTVVAALH